MSNKDKKVWLSGFYQPTMGDWEEWQGGWSMSDDEDTKGWIWFDGEYSEKTARAKLKRNSPNYHVS